MRRPPKELRKLFWAGAFRSSGPQPRKGDFTLAGDEDAEIAGAGLSLSGPNIRKSFLILMTETWQVFQVSRKNLQP